MNKFNDYIVLPRDFIDWQWYQDIVITGVFIHLLLTAKAEPVKWQNRILNPGQAVINQVRLAAGLGFSRHQIQTALTKLIKSGEITIETTNRNTIVTVLNWDEYCPKCVDVCHE